MASQDQQQEGYILVAVLLVLAVTSLMGAAILSQSMTSMRIARRTVESEQALYLANAGIEHALAQVAANGAPTATTTLTKTLPIANNRRGQYTAVLELAANNTIQVHATGTFGDSSRTVDATFELPISVQEPAFAQAVYSQGALSVDQNVTIYGDLYGQQEMTLGNHVNVKAYGTAKGVAQAQTIALAKNARVEGGTCSAAAPPSPGALCTSPPPTYSLPELDASQLWEEATLRVNDLTLTGTQAYEDGLIWVQGNLTAKGGFTYRGKVTFAVTDQVRLGGMVQPDQAWCAENGPCSAAFISLQSATPDHPNVEILNNANVDGLIYAIGQINVGSSATVRGNISGGDVELRPAVTVYHEPGYIAAGLPGLPGTGSAVTAPPLITSWTAPQ